MSQAKLARELNISDATLHKYLSGLRQPPEGFYIAAAAVLGCSPDELKPEEGVAA